MTLGIDTSDKHTISIHKEYSIESFNWTLEFIFKQDRYSEKEILEITNNLGPLLDEEDRNKLPVLFKQNTYNSALSVSDKSNRKTFILITQVTSIGQFVDSLVHEMLHTSRHINECENNEKLFTILGNISGDIVNILYSL